MAGHGTGPRPVIPGRTTFAGSGTMSKTIACCNDEPGPSFIFDVQLDGRSVRNLAAPRDPARRTSVPGRPDPTAPSGRHASSWNRPPQGRPAMCARSRTIKIKIESCVTSSMQVRPDGLRTVGRTPQSRPAVLSHPYAGMNTGAAVGGAFTGTVGAARPGMPAQAPAPAGTDAATTGVALAASERPRR